MRAVIDGDRCTGHGRCYVLSPGLFTDDERGYGQVIGDGSFAEQQRADSERAVQGCPEQAIRIEED
jgi:ferredoxin